MWNGFVQETTTSSHVGDLASRLSSFEKTVIEQELMRHGFPKTNLYCAWSVA